jgi:iron complex outermembrane recepter protein
MRFLITLLFLNNLLLAQNVFRGQVLDSETDKPLYKANIIVEGKEGIGASTDISGNFILENVPPGDVLLISYIGYDSERRTVIPKDFETPVKIYLNPGIIPAQTVLVEGSLGKEGITPVTFDKIKRKEIEENYTVQDIPEYLSYLPSTTFYSEGGMFTGWIFLIFLQVLKLYKFKEEREAEFLVILQLAVLLILSLQFSRINLRSMFLHQQEVTIQRNILPLFPAA